MAARELSVLYSVPKLFLRAFGTKIWKKVQNTVQNTDSVLYTNSLLIAPKEGVTITREFYSLDLQS